MEKQIEEMAKALMDTINANHGHISMRKLAEALVNAGYRKASDMALEVIGKIEEATENHIKAISRLDPQNDYCAGGKKALDMTLKVLAELKKEYIGEDINAPTKAEEGK